MQLPQASGKCQNKEPWTCTLPCPAPQHGHAKCPHPRVSNLQIASCSSHLRKCHAGSGLPHLAMPLFSCWHKEVRRLFVPQGAFLGMELTASRPCNGREVGQQQGVVCPDYRGKSHHERPSSRLPALWVSSTSGQIGQNPR